MNLTLHEQHVKRRCTQYRPAFGIDCLIDNAREVEIEGRKYDFNVLRVAPDDED